MNTFGTLFRLTTFGESHGPAIGGVVDGMPAGITLDLDFILSELQRRRPGKSDLTTSRNEPDTPEFLSGVLDGVTTGTPIGFIIRNRDQRSADYDSLKDLYRPSHADYTYDIKYGIRDHRGGGRSSARETAVRVVGGALAKLFLRERNITVSARLSQVGDETEPARMEELIRTVKSEGDSIGGIVSCVVKGCPAGLGEPVYDKLHAALGGAMLGINACHGFDYGAGFEGVGMKGSEQNDVFTTDEKGNITTLTNFSGGIQGGISNGQDICFRALFKPTATIMKEQRSITQNGAPTTLRATGRHDPCVALRAVPVVEAMAAMTIADFLLLSTNNRGNIL
ncbi:MAG: chorismate synthase [Bacteroidaceae bacterium]|nr:chorismate synthase [Bacteroidaceae bacterium]